MNTYEINYSGEDIDSAVYKLFNYIKIIKFYSHTGTSGNPIAVFIGAPGTYIKWERMNLPSGYSEFYEEGAPGQVVFSETKDYLVSEDINLIVRSYRVVVTVINGTYSGPPDWNETIPPSSDTPLVLTVTPLSGYRLPSSITTGNVDCDYDNTRGTISLTQATGYVHVRVICVSE